MKYFKHLYIFLLFLGLISDPLQTKAVYVVNQEHKFIECIEFYANSEENEWLGLLYLDENGKLAINPNGAVLSQQNQKFFKNPELVDAWKILDEAGVGNLANKIDDIEFVGKHLDEIKGAGGYKAWRDVAIQADNVSAFSNLTSAQKLENIKNVWNTKYPIEDMLGGRSFFKDVMGQYRYTKSSGWSHTGEISFNVKGIDFYKGSQLGDEIFANSAVSMKTTVQTNVETWLKYASIQDNIKFLREGLSDVGMLDKNNSLRMFIENAEIHVYMKKANITPSLEAQWLNKLNSDYPDIKFEIKAIEDFVN